jgi:transcriptional regulator with XRE-family HTH domain
MRYTPHVVARKSQKESAGAKGPRRSPVLRLLGAQLLRLRLDRKISQQELAARAQINYKHLGRLERAQSEAGAEILVQIARALDVPVGELFERVTPSDKVPYRLSPADLDEVSDALGRLTALVERIAAKKPRSGPSRAPRRQRR